MSAVPFRAALCGLLLSACATSHPAPPPPAPSPAPPPPAPSPYVAAARPLFDGCEGQTIAKGRAYSCGGGEVQAWLTDMGAVDPITAMQIGLRALHAMVPGERPVAVTELTLAGKPWPSAPFSACSSEKPESCVSGRMVAVAAPDGSGTRLMGCGSRTPAQEQRCHDMLDYLARQGTPEGKPLAAFAAPTTPVLLARSLAVPKDCQLLEAHERGGRMGCADGTGFQWMMDPSASPASISTQVTGIVSGLEEQFGAKARRVPCRVEQMTTTCSVMDVKAQGAAATVYVGGASGDKGAVVAICRVAAPAQPFPPVCNGVFALP